MRTKLGARGLAAIAVLLVAGVLPAAAQQDKQMSAEEKAAMEAWMKYATPGPKHKLLEPFVGTWSVTTTWWQAPGAPPSTSQGTSENTWVLGGRFLQQKVTSEMMGQPFEGIGYTGYDNYKKHFVGTWMDSMGTMVMVSSGHADASGKVLTFTGKIDDVVAGKTVTVREITRVVDNNHHVFEMYGPDPSGKEFKTMEIAYTRK
jgi:hypothetical protein